FEEKKSPKGNSYGLITVLEESKETYTILSRNEEDVNILQNTAIDSAIDLSFYIENGFNLLEKINDITDSSSNPEQENTAKENNKSISKKKHKNQKENGKVTRLETGKKGNMEFIKMA